MALRINLERRDTAHDLGHGVTVTCRPITSSIWFVAEETARAAVEGVEDPAARRGLAYAALYKTLARSVVVGWSGVEIDGDEGGGPAPVTPETIDAVFDFKDLLDRFSIEVAGRYLTMVQEKNALSSSLSGTLAGAAPTVPPAKSDAKTVPPAGLPH